MAVKIDKDLYLKNIKEIYNIPGSIKTVEHYLTELVDGYNNLVDEEVNSEFILIEKTLPYGAESITWTETERDNLMQNICILKLISPKDTSENPEYTVYYLFCVGHDDSISKYSVIDGLTEVVIHELSVIISSSSLSSDIINTYARFGTDAPIHFIKLTSTTLTEALRSEILSDDYFVILEYDNNYYYEKSKRISNNVITQKDFETMCNFNATTTGTLGYDRYFTSSYNTASIYNDSLQISLGSGSTKSLDISNGKNIASKYINSKTTDVNTNASQGQVLTADGSGGCSWQTPSGGGGGSSASYYGYELKLGSMLGIGGFNAYCLCENPLTNEYGWHKIDYIEGQNVSIDGTSYTTTGADNLYHIPNCGLIIFTSFNTGDLDNFSSGLYEGNTVITSSNVTSNVGKTLHFRSNVTIQYLD